MILTGAMLLAVVLAVLSVAAVLKVQLGLSFAQAVLYAPLKLVWNIDDRRIRIARRAQTPVHLCSAAPVAARSGADAVAAARADTLHILDEDSARSTWLEPWRELGRTIAFNAEHVFVSRRLVRQLQRQRPAGRLFPRRHRTRRQGLSPLSRGRPHRQ